MKHLKRLSLVTAITVVGMTSSLVAADSLSKAFSNGELKGSLKSYYFAQDFDGAGKNDSSIWANGGHLNFVTDSYNGFVLGTTVQFSSVASIDDKDAKTTGSMDAQGAVLSESYLQYTFDNTTFKGGRQFVKTPLLAGSGSRLIKESFEAYLAINTDLPDTTLVGGVVTKYQTRTDKSSYADNVAAVDFQTDGTGEPGNFNDIKNDGVKTLYIKNNSIPNMTIQGQYAQVNDVLSAIYADAKYDFKLPYKPFIAVQYYDTNYDSVTGLKDNSLYGLKAGVNISGVDLFAGYTSNGNSSVDGDARTFRGIGQGAYAHYTATTKTAGNNAFIAGTDAWQVGAGYKFNDLKTKLRYTSFDDPSANADLDETTLNFEYQFGGNFKNLKAQVDFSILDYEDNTKDATDLRTRLIYSF
jgi:hypothetical protein